MNDDLDPRDETLEGLLEEDATDGDPELNPEPTALEPSAELPDKYKGKSVADIVRMHQEAEKALGRQGAEVGELRRVVDEFIKRQFDNPNPNGKVPNAAALEEPDFFREPEKAVKAIVESDPHIRELKEHTEVLRRQAALNRLEKSHPDFQEVVGDPEFQEWVGKSRVRTGLMARADAEYDFDAADELFSTFKALKGVKAPTGAAGNEAREIVDAGTRKAGQTLPHARTTPTDTSMGPKGKIWKRRAIIELMKDPAKYAPYAAEIRQAYTEGRVR